MAKDAHCPPELVRFLRPISELKPYNRNPRRIPDAAVDAVAASIERYKFRNPIIATEDGEIVAGHTRYAAALKLGIEKVPVISASDLSPDLIREFRLADNRVAEFSDWEQVDLEQELASIFREVGNYPVGFDDTPLDDLEDVPPEELPDDPPGGGGEKPLEFECPKCGHHFKP